MLKGDTNSWHKLSKGLFSNLISTEMKAFNIWQIEYSLVLETEKAGGQTINVVSYNGKERRSKKLLKVREKKTREPGIIRAKGIVCLKKGRMVDCVYLLWHQ